MSLLKAEIQENATAFEVSWRAERSAVDSALSASAHVFLESYERMTSLQAWRTHLEPLISPGSLAFFLEAQNDALTSHVFACMGSWRSALKALRSTIDNVLFCLYYKDHPIELILWEKGDHKPTFSDLFTYCDHHPARVTVPEIDALPVLRKEYSTLSKAVHASSATFRMTKNVKETLLWSADQAQLSMWEKRARTVLESVNLILLSHYRSTLSGGAAKPLKEVVSLAVAPKRRAQITKHLQVVLH